MNFMEAGKCSKATVPELVPLSVYVHYPFCKRKCPYCDFNSYPKNKPGLRGGDGRYTKALAQELNLLLERYAPLIEQRPIISLFLGGGTPSLWDLEQLADFLTLLREKLSFAPDAEWSMEVNPGTAVNQAYFKELLSLGINRLSIGVQSFDDSCLKALGRIHDGTQAERSAAAAREAGFERLNLDIMHGLPGQDVSLALADLDKAARYATHLSWYELTLEEDCYFGKHPPRLPDEQELEQMEQAGFDRLEQHGFRRYEISAFTRERHCVHNENYWRFGDYLGLGAGAHSKLTARGSAGKADGNRQGRQVKVWRRANAALPEAYVEQLAAGGAPYQQVDPEDLPFEFMLNRLRLFEPVAVADFEALTGLNFALAVRDKLQQAQGFGLIEFAQDGQSFSVTSKGRLMLNSVLELFLDEGN